VCNMFISYFMKILNFYDGELWEVPLLHLYSQPLQVLH
jgi:hypothetical protein